MSDLSATDNNNIKGVTTYTGTVTFTSKPKIEESFDGARFYERFYYLGIEVDGQELKFRVVTAKVREHDLLFETEDGLPKPWKGDTVEVSTRSRAKTAWKSVRSWRGGENLTIVAEGGAREEWKAQKDAERAEEDRRVAEERAANIAKEEEYNDWVKALEDEHIPQDVRDLETKTFTYHILHKFLGDCLDAPMYYGTRARRGRGGTPGSGLCRASIDGASSGPFYDKPGSWVRGFIGIVNENGLITQEGDLFTTTSKGEEMYLRLHEGVKAIRDAKKARRVEEHRLGEEARKAKRAEERATEDRERVLLDAKFFIRYFVKDGDGTVANKAIHLLLTNGVSATEATTLINGWLKDYDYNGEEVTVEEPQ